jgi:hypothetical protein
MDTTTVLAVMALVALATATGCLTQLHRLAPEVAPIRDAVSDYGAGPHASWYRAQVVLLGLSAAAVAAGLGTAGFESGGVVWLYVFAASRILIAGFPVDLPGSERTSTGVIHNLLATTAFASIAVAASTLSGDLIDDLAWSLDGAWYGWAGTLVVVAAVALAVAWVVPTLRRSVFGAVERCWYAVTIAWLGVSAIGLLGS